MSLQGMEGKMFSPLAVTISIALMVALVVSVMLSPVLCDYALKGGSEKDTKIVALLKSLYLRLLNSAFGASEGDHRWSSVGLLSCWQSACIHCLVNLLFQS